MFGKNCGLVSMVEKVQKISLMWEGRRKFCGPGKKLENKKVLCFPLRVKLRTSI
jgi:hypothetical protein